MGSVNGRAGRAGAVDANIMVGLVPQGPGYRDVEALLAVLDELRIARAAVASTRAWRHEAHAGNLALSATLAGTARLHATWVLLPATCQETPPAAELLAMAAEADVAAFRICPDDHGWDPLGPGGEEVMEMAAAYGAPVLVDLDQVGWGRVDALAARHPELPLVVTSTGYRTLRETAAVMRRRANVRVDTSYLGSSAGLEWIVETFGPDRVLFGTGAPLRDPVDATLRVRLSQLDESSGHAVAHGNFDRLMAGRNLQ